MAQHAMTRQHIAKKRRGPGTKQYKQKAKRKAREGGKSPKGKGEKARKGQNKCVWGVSPGEKGSVT